MFEINIKWTTAIVQRLNNNLDIKMIYQEQYCNYLYRVVIIVLTTGGGTLGGTDSLMPLWIGG